MVEIPELKQLIPVGIFRGLEILFAILVLIMMHICTKPEIGVNSVAKINFTLIKGKTTIDDEAEYMECLSPNFEMGAGYMTLVVFLGVVFLLANIVLLVLFVLNIFGKCPVLYSVAFGYAIAQAVSFLMCVIILAAYAAKSAAFVAQKWYGEFEKAFVTPHRYTGNWNTASAIAGINIVVCLLDAGFHFYFRRQMSAGPPNASPGPSPSSSSRAPAPP